ncbi:hypothetical protein MKW94_019902, partial [Papaver nudicaule]|nr:hypothetical protein [Papaver nudicaule]
SFPCHSGGNYKRSWYHYWPTSRGTVFFNCLSQEEETELQCVPGQFESLEEYVRVFEPLLFEECRAQLYSTWEESTETISRDVHIMVRIKTVERRERGWYDAVVLPVSECKWTFKEGDVAVLSCPRPGS